MDDENKIVENTEEVKPVKKPRGFQKGHKYGANRKGKIFAPSLKKLMKEALMTQNEDGKPVADEVIKLMIERMKEGDFKYIKWVFDKFVSDAATLKKVEKVGDLETQLDKLSEKEYMELLKKYLPDEK